MTFATAFDDVGRQFIWNSSSLKPAEECLRKYQYEIQEGWTTPNQSVHLVFGGHYAKAHEHFFLHLANGMDREAALIAVVREAMINSWNHDRDAEGQRIEGTGRAWESFDANKTRETLIRSIIWYHDHFREDPAKVLHNSAGQPLVEYEGVVDVDNGLMFSVHLDAAVEYAHDPYVMDQKSTKSTISPRYFEGYNPDIQMSLYTFAGRAIFNIPVKGVIIDAAQIAVGFTRFERGFTMRTTDQLDEWYDDTMTTIERARTAVYEQYFPMNRTACSNYGGCPFRAACSRDRAVRKQFLEAQYIQRGRREPLEPR